MITINSFLLVYILIFLLSTMLDIAVDLVNSSHLKKYNGEVLEGFEGIIDEKRLAEMESYTRVNTGFGVLKTSLTRAVFIIILLSGVLPWLQGIISNWHYIPAGLIFFAFPGVIGFLTDIPFDYYHTFRIEDRFGFNTSNIRTWLADLVKSVIIGVIIFSIILSVLLFMIRHTGNTWWIWTWLFFISFQLLMVVLYPTLIAPLFNKFEPIKDKELGAAIMNLAENEGIHIKDIYQMDAGKRSRHTNAYFTGLGKVKRIVLFDTLISSHNRDEILSVLAHEIGHLKLGHIRKMIFLITVASFVLFFIASRVIEWELLYKAFGFNSMPHYIGIFLLAALLEPVGFFLSPFSMALSRRHEREADDYVSRALKDLTPFINALKKMAADNLSNLRPHPLYVRFHYSHPPVIQRIKRLEEISLQDTAVSA